MEKHENFGHLIRIFYKFPIFYILNYWNINQNILYLTVVLNHGVILYKYKTIDEQIDTCIFAYPVHIQIKKNKNRCKKLGITESIDVMYNIAPFKDSILIINKVQNFHQNNCFFLYHHRVIYVTMSLFGVEYYGAVS
ncbi:hypothetical protein ACJX0J_031612 [Zea mays]